MNAHYVNLIRPYAGWAAGALLATAIFIGLIATTVAFPLFLFASACALAAFRYWDDLKTFDFWALDEWIRTRRDSIGIRDWHAAHHAAEYFCSPVVVKARNEAAAEMNSIMMELIRDKGRADTGAYFSSTATSLISENNTGRTHTHYDVAQARYNQCNTALSRELLELLTRGNLFAKGLLMRDDTAMPERVIPTSRWRVMSLDIAKDTASGAGWSYTGILVGKKQSDVKLKKLPGAPPLPANK